MSGETIRDVIMRIRIEMADGGKLRAPDVSAAKKEIDTLQQAYQKAMNGGAGGNGANTGQFQQQQLQSFRQRAEALNNIGEGALRAGRGIAFFTAATEDDLRVALQYVAVAQGMFDVYAGFANVLKGVTALRVLDARATSMQAAANAALAASQIAASRSAIAAGGGRAAAAAAAAGVVGAAGGVAGAAGAGAAGGTVAGAFSAVTAAVASTAAVTLPLAAAVLAFRAKLQSWTAEQERLNPIVGESALLAKRSADATGKMQTTRRHFSEQLQVNFEQIGLRNPGDFDSQLSSLDVLQRRRRGDIESAHTQGKFGIGSEARTAADTEISKSELEIQRQRVAVLESAGEAMERERQAALASYDIAARRYQQEQQRYESFEAKIGRLNQGELARLKIIQDQVKAGKELNDQELAFLEQIGVGDQFTQNKRREEGQRRGAEGFAETFGDNADLKAARAELDSAKGFQQQANELAAKMTEFEQVRNDTQKKLIDMIEAVLKREQALEDQVKAFADANAAAAQKQQRTLWQRINPF